MALSRFERIQIYGEEPTSPVPRAQQDPFAFPEQQEQLPVQEAPPLPEDRGMLMRVMNTISAPIFAVSNFAKGEFAEGASVLAKGLSGGELTGLWQMDKDERDTMSDVLGHYGMEEGWQRSTLGFVGDVLLDPLTYLSGGASIGAKAAFTGTRAVAKAGAQQGLKKIATSRIKKFSLSLIGDKAINELVEKGAKELAEESAKRLGTKASKEAANVFKQKAAREVEENFFYKLGKEAGAKGSDDVMEEAGLKYARQNGYIDLGGINFEVPFVRKSRRNLISHEAIKGFFAKRFSENTAEAMAKQVSANVAFPLIGGAFSGAYHLLGKTKAFTDFVQKIHPSALMSEGDLFLHTGAKKELAVADALVEQTEGLFRGVDIEKRGQIMGIFETKGREGLDELFGASNKIPEGSSRFADNELFYNYDKGVPRTLSEAYENLQENLLTKHILMNGNFSPGLKVLEDLGVGHRWLKKYEKNLYQGKFVELEKMAKKETDGVILTDGKSIKQIEDHIQILKKIGRRENHVFHMASNHGDWKTLLNDVEFNFSKSDLKKTLNAVFDVREAIKSKRFLQKSINRSKFYDEFNLSGTQRKAADRLLDQSDDLILSKLKKAEASSDEFKKGRVYDTLSQGEDAGLIYEKDAVKVMTRQVQMLGQKRMISFLTRNLDNYSRIGERVFDDSAKFAKEINGISKMLQKYGVKDANEADNIIKSIGENDFNAVDKFIDKAVANETKRQIKAQLFKGRGFHINPNEIQSNIEVAVEGARRIITGETDLALVKSEIGVTKTRDSFKQFIGKLGERQAKDSEKLAMQLEKGTSKAGKVLAKKVRENVSHLYKASSESGSLATKINSAKARLKTLGVSGETVARKGADVLTGEVRAMTKEVTSLAKSLDEVISSLGKRGNKLEARALKNWANRITIAKASKDITKIGKELKGLRDASRKIDAVFSKRVDELYKSLNKKSDILRGKKSVVDEIKSLDIKGLEKRKSIVDDRIKLFGKKAGDLYESASGMSDELAKFTEKIKTRSASFSDNLLTRGEIKLEKALAKSEEKFGKATDTYLKNNIKTAVLGDVKIQDLNLSPGMSQVLGDLLDIEVPGALMKAMMDTTNTYIKPFLTVYNPSFHMRNFLSGVTMAAMNPRLGFPELVRSLMEFPQNMATAMGAGKMGAPIRKLLSESNQGIGAYNMMSKNGGKKALPDDVLKALTKEIKNEVTGEVRTIESLIDLAKREGVLGKGFESELEAVQKLSGGKGASGLIEDKARASMKFMADVATNGEDSMRFTHFLNNFKKGLSPGEAAEQSKRWFVDYAPSSNFERKLRVVFPFYKFTKQVLVDYGPEIARRPGSIAPYKALANLNEKEENVPEWMKKTFTVPVGKDKNGDPLYITGFGLAIESMQNAMSFNSALSMLNPIIKWPVEVGAGKNFFFGSEYASYNAPYQSILNLPDPIKDQFLDRHVNKSGETYYTMNPKVREVIDRMPMYRQFATINKISDTRHNFFVNVANAMTGLKFTSLDQRQRDRVVNEMIEKSLKKAEQQGRVSKFTNYYQRDYQGDRPAELLHQDNVRKNYKAKKKKDREDFEKQLSKRY